MFANFSLNQTTEARDSYGLWAKCQIIEKMKGTCELHYRRGQRRSLIARSGRRKIEGLSWIKFVPYSLKSVGLILFDY